MREDKKSRELASHDYLINTCMSLCLDVIAKKPYLCICESLSMS